MFRLAALVLTMSKPLAGVNSPAVVFGYLSRPAVSAEVGRGGSDVSCARARSGASNMHVASTTVSAAWRVWNVRMCYCFSRAAVDPLAAVTGLGREAYGLAPSRCAM